MGKISLVSGILILSIVGKSHSGAPRMFKNMGNYGKLSKSVFVVTAYQQNKFTFSGRKS